MTVPAGDVHRDAPNTDVPPDRSYVLAVAVPVTTVQDERLTSSALGVLVWLLAVPDPETVEMTVAQVAAGGPPGSLAGVLDDLDLLAVTGYLTWQRRDSDGFPVINEVADAPVLPPPPDPAATIRRAYAEVHHPSAPHSRDATPPRDLS